MSGAAPQIAGTLYAARAKAPARSATSEPAAVRGLLIFVTIAFLGLFLFLPLLVLFHEALSQGWHAYLAALGNPFTLSAIRMTLLIAGVAVPLNLVFGLAAAWCIARFEFPGKSLLTTLIDLPLAISPVIAGLIFVLIFGAGMAGPVAVGPWDQDHVRRAGDDPGHDLRHVSLRRAGADPADACAGQRRRTGGGLAGRRGVAIFWRVTLPNVKWGLLYGVILCNARAMGEFGAVSVVSAGTIGQTNTLPLHVQFLYESATRLIMRRHLPLLRCWRCWPS